MQDCCVHKRSTCEVYIQGVTQRGTDKVYKNVYRKGVKEKVYRQGVKEKVYRQGVQERFRDQCQTNVTDDDENTVFLGGKKYLDLVQKCPSIFIAVNNF